jgi:WD40 repeat protein
VRTRSVTWLGNTGHIAVAEELPETVGFRVIIQDTAGTARRLVVRSPDPISSLTVSPDGRRMVYSSGPVDRDIVEYSFGGTFVREVATSVALEGFPSWSPAGDRFVYQVGGPGHPDSLWMSDATGTATTMLQRLGGRGVGRFPQVSPEGTRVAFLDSTSLSVVSAAGGQAIRLVTGEESPTGACWSSDGEWIFYSQGPTRLAKVPSQGGAPVPIAAGPGELIACSPDGQWLARRGRDGYVLTSTDGTTDRPLASYTEHARAPNSPQFGDGGRILYLLGSDRRTIVVRDAATGRVTRTIPFTLPPEDVILDFGVHPGGTRVLLSTGGDRYDLWMAEGFAQPATSWRRWFRHWQKPSAETR